MNFFSEKVAIVTGGSSGLGRAICVELANRGARVAFCGRREKEGLETERIIKEYGKDAMFVPCDISNSSQVKNFIEKTIQKYSKISFAINNAAIAGSMASVIDYSEEDFDTIMNVNLKGCWLSMKYEIPAILANGGGAIVNIASTMGLVGGKFGIAPYSATKHGIIGLTKSSALEFADKNLRINVLCPGIIDTEMNDEIFKGVPNLDEAKKKQKQAFPMKRIATPEEVAKSAIWLCSDEASFITGAAIPVDGGWTAQ